MNNLFRIALNKTHLLPDWQMNHDVSWGVKCRFTLVMNSHIWPKGKELMKFRARSQFSIWKNRSRGNMLFVYVSVLKLVALRLLQTFPCCSVDPEDSLSSYRLQRVSKRHCVATLGKRRITLLRAMLLPISPCLLLTSRTTRSGNFVKAVIPLSSPNPSLTLPRFLV